jgi:hypothetical protein
MLPRVSLPHAGIDGTNLQAAKRARESDLMTSSVSTIPSAMFPMTNRVIGYAPRPTLCIANAQVAPSVAPSLTLRTDNNATYQKQTDPYTQFNFILRPLQLAGTQTLTSEMRTDALVFFYRKTRVTDHNVYMAERRVTAIGLPQFQYHIDNEYNEGKMNVDNVFDAWTLGGVLTSHKPLPGADEETRSAVVSTRGDMRLTNHWGNVHFGQHLWFILKEVKDPRRLTFGLNEAGTVSREPKDMQLRLVPIATDSKKLTWNDLKYTCKHGKERMGRVIYIGRVIQNLAYSRISNTMTDNDVKSHLTTIDMKHQAMAKCIDVSVGIDVMLS